MSTEQLKLLLDAFSAFGATGKDAFIWWLVLDKGLPVIGWLFTVVGLCLTVFRAIAWGRQYSRMDELRTACGHSAYSDPSFEKTAAECFAKMKEPT